MRWFRSIVFTLAAVLCATAPGRAQAPSKPQAPPSDLESTIAAPSGGPVTPEMWLYMQEYQRQKQPKEAVRRKAELRSAQRQSRLEAQRWFGISNLRPMANPIPFYAAYSPTWVGDRGSPYSWYGTGYPYVVYHTVSRDR